MNQYIFTISPDIPVSREQTAEMINAMIPGRLEALYTHFLQPSGVEGCATPLVIAWQRSSEAGESILVLIDWNVTTRDLAAECMYIAQQFAESPTLADYLWTTHQHRHHYTRAHHDYLVKVGQFLAAAQIRGIPITHAFATPLGNRYGTMAGLPLNAAARQWIENSLKLTPHKD